MDTVELNKAIERFNDSVRKITDELRTMLNRLVKSKTEAWNKAIERFNNAVRKISDEPRTMLNRLVKSKKVSTPKKYGTFLSSNFHPKLYLKTYNYMPIASKNLPYQRRKF